MKRFVAAHLGLMVVLVGSTAFAQAPPINENLKCLKPLIGKWTGDFTLQENMEDLGKEGDTIEVMVHYRWTKNRNAITLYVETKLDGEWVNVTNGLIVWDALQKKITAVDAYSSGGLFRCEIEAQGDKIVCRGRGTTGDGVPTELTVVYRGLTKESITGQFLNQKEGDKKIPDGKPYTLTRVTK
jgi:hypothetical protein